MARHGHGPQRVGGPAGRDEGAGFSLRKLDFAGTATLKALPGAPWKEGETLKVKLMRLDAYGNMRELKLERNGEELDGKDWIKEK